jgi:hypothetical protein
VTLGEKRNFVSFCTLICVVVFKCSAPPAEFSIGAGLAYDYAGPGLAGTPALKRAKEAFH